jgi:NAD(P)-dependent dehydrogenase (short-subunit alcohol dehydrogenase family)
MQQSSILVTGGGGGIGAMLARRAAREGWFVLVAGRNLERLEAAASDARRNGGGAAALELDLADPESIRRALETAQTLCEGLGPIEALVNCAGIAISAPVFGGADELYEQHMAVNFHGARRMIEALAPTMRALKRGRIVNVASSAGLRGYAYTSAYCASKHALLGYTRAVAQEFAGSGVSISAVCPHFVDSPLTDASVQRLVEKTDKSEVELRAYFARQNPGGRLISTTEVADAIWSLVLGEENGTILELDGERVLRVEGPVMKRA